MNKTYNEILNNMKSNFYAKTGESVDDISDLGVRFSAVASEIFSLSCYGDYILNQAFIQTATGEYLDKLASIRNITRKTPTKATGVLTFTMAENYVAKITIPKNTICSVSGSPFIEFATDETVVVEVGTTSVDINATALNIGDKYNVSKNTVTNMVNPPSGVDSVTNKSNICGGYDLESDQALRTRIIDSYIVPPNGINAQSIANVVMNHEEITDCKIYNDNDVNEIIAVIKPKTGLITEKIKNIVDDALMVAKFNYIYYKVVLAQKADFNLIIEVYSKAPNIDEILTQVNDYISDYLSGLRIGESVSISKIASLASNFNGIDYVNVSSDKSAGANIICDSMSYLRLNNLSVVHYDE